EPAPMVELLNRAHQAQVAFLDQVEQRQAAPQILLGDAHDETQIRFDQPPLGAFAAGVHVVEELAQLVFTTRGNKPLPQALRGRWLERRIACEQAQHGGGEQSRVDRKANDERLCRARIQADLAAKSSAQVEVGHVVEPLAYRCRLQELRDVLDV